MAKLKMKTPGFSFCSVKAGIKKSGLPDMALIVSNPPANAAGVFTTNTFAAPPVTISKQRLKGKRKTNAILINSGNANAATGHGGVHGAEQLSDALAEQLNVSANSILLASTGVIGRQLPITKMMAKIPDLASGLRESKMRDVARAIMTTDTKMKVAESSFRIADRDISVCGFAKGAGMIQPNMATMLSFILTDADVDKKFLNHALKSAVAESFNRITIDGECSTNDSVFLLANGLAGNKTISDENAAGKLFISALTDVCLNLAKQIVRDGEGASHMVEINVNGAANQADAKKAAYAVANSLLVKTAIHGKDANWGRIVSSLGASGAKFFYGNVDVYIGDAVIVYAGEATDEQNLKRARKEMRKREFEIRIELNSGEASEKVYTCDLSKEYIKINAEYTT